MQVDLLNDGPVTILIDTNRRIYERKVYIANAFRIKICGNPAAVVPLMPGYPMN
jgi:hypothetical protein